MPSKYQKQVKGDHNVASEVGSHNLVVMDFGAGGVIAICFALLLASAAVIWLVIAHAALIALAVLFLFVLTIAGAVTVGGLYVARQVSATRTQLVEDKHRQMWSRIVYPLGSHVVIHDPTTNTVSVHNARDIVENRHFNDRPQIAESAESLDSGMPPASDLMR